MYDIPFSQQWILDLCLNDLNIVRIFIAIPLIIIICTLLYQLMKFKTLAELGWRFFTSLFFLFILIFMYYFIFFLVGIFNCSMSTFYRGVNPAHAIHAQIKQRILEDKNIPQNLEDLQKMDPNNYYLMTIYTKVNYIFDPKTKNYTFFVRPSKHGVVIFDSKRDYKIYDLHKILFNKEQTPTNSFMGSYPPDYPGPWDKLPE